MEDKCMLNVCLSSLNKVDYYYYYYYYYYYNYYYYTEFHCQRNFIFISSFKYVYNMQTFVCDYHLNDPTTFLHHQIQVCSANARILALGYNKAFSVIPVHGLVIFQHHAQI